jgi:RecB family endonuclease NucS
MLERDLQDYLFDNPDVLFPNQTVSKKRREVYIEGRRIDLLFDVDDIQYIIELKRDTIKREDIGQVFEYYGLMRQLKPTASYRMVLVAPSIPEFRRTPLEEMGIRCVEVKHAALNLEVQHFALG